MLMSVIFFSGWCWPDRRGGFGGLHVLFGLVVVDTGSGNILNPLVWVFANHLVLFRPPEP
jgi:hypothetical protein